VKILATAPGWSYAHEQLFALSAPCGDEFAAFFVARFLEVLVLTELLGKPLFFASLFETAQKLLHILAGSAFNSDHLLTSQ
jgi:hypothetical protein